MNLLQFSIDTFTALSKYDNCVTSEEMNPQIEFANIWDECYMKLKSMYKLPDLSLTGEGFEKGKAMVVECIDTANIIRKLTKKDVYFCNPSEYTLFDFLNDEFIRLMQPEVSKLISSYESYCQGYLNTTKLKTA